MSSGTGAYTGRAARCGAALMPWTRTAGPPVEQPRPAYPPEESEANEFAAALLMPAALVRQHYERWRKADPSGLFARMCSSFGASGAAMGRRLNRVI